MTVNTDVHVPIQQKTYGLIRRLTDDHGLVPRLCNHRPRLASRSCHSLSYGSVGLEALASHMMTTDGERDSTDWSNHGREHPSATCK